MRFEDLTALPCLWDALAAESRTILLYGTGNGADKILDELERRGVSCAGVFASDGFVRSREFRGMRVISYPDAVARFGEDIVILVAFGSPRDEVIGFVETLAARHTVFIPDVPLFAEDAEAELFTPAFAEAHRSEIEAAAALFSDEASRELFYEVLAYRITGDMKYLRRTEEFGDSVASLLPGDIRRVIDAGAFNGDTARTFISAFPEVKKIVCVEPDARTFRKLAEFAATDSRVTAINASVGASDGTDIFNSSSSRASSTGAQNRRAKCVEVRRLTVDRLTGRSRAGDRDGYSGAAEGDGRLLIKLDVEGAELAAIEGAKQTLAEEKPALAAAVYHRTGDIFTIPLTIADAEPGRRFALRRARCFPCWELTLFVW